MNESFNAVQLLLVNSKYIFSRWSLGFDDVYEYAVSVFTYEPALYQTPEYRVVYTYSDSLTT
jgi:hypothetical protein